MTDAVGGLEEETSEGSERRVHGAADGLCRPHALGLMGEDGVPPPPPCGVPHHEDGPCPKSQGPLQETLVGRGGRPTTEEQSTQGQEPHFQAKMGAVKPHDPERGWGHCGKPPRGPAQVSGGPPGLLQESGSASSGPASRGRRRHALGKPGPGRRGSLSQADTGDPEGGGPEGRSGGLQPHPTCGAEPCTLQDKDKNLDSHH